MSTHFYQLSSYLPSVPDIDGFSLRPRLTSAAARVLGACIAVFREKGRDVSYREVGARLGISPQGVAKQVPLLVTLGHVRVTGVNFGLRPLRNAHGRAVVQPDVIAIPILGTVAAGEPIEAVDTDPETFPIPAAWCQGDCYLLRVRGESMTGDGIEDGDLVLVEATNQVQTGAIHVCWLPGDGATIKRVRTRADVTELVASNERFVPVPAPHGTIVQGRIIWVLRRLGPKKRRRRT
ncbi:MAG: hypothetical protein IT336_15120 [Thermomicrobiales bacterium]|nr:hypothetical protein [Thermomicrobiales bacterium]